MSPLPFSQKAFHPEGRPFDRASRSGFVLERFGYSGSGGAADFAAALDDEDLDAFADEEEDGAPLAPPPPNFFRQSPCTGCRGEGATGHPIEHSEEAPGPPRLPLDLLGCPLNRL